MHTNLDRCLVGLDLADGIKLLDLVTGLHKPRRDLTLGYALPILDLSPFLASKSPSTHLRQCRRADMALGR